MLTKETHEKSLEALNNLLTKYAILVDLNQLKVTTGNAFYANAVVKAVFKYCQSAAIEQETAARIRMALEVFSKKSESYGKVHSLLAEINSDNPEMIEAFFVFGAFVELILPEKAVLFDSFDHIKNYLFTKGLWCQEVLQILNSFWVKLPNQVSVVEFCNFCNQLKNDNLFASFLSLHFSLQNLVYWAIIKRSRLQALEPVRPIFDRLQALHEICEHCSININELLAKINEKNQKHGCQKSLDEIIEVIQDAHALAETEFVPTDDIVLNLFRVEEEACQRHQRQSGHRRSSEVSEDDDDLVFALPPVRPRSRTILPGSGAAAEAAKAATTAVNA